MVLTRILNHSLQQRRQTMRSPDDEAMIRFYGTSTIRLDGIPGKSKTFVDFMQDPLMHEVCRAGVAPKLPGLSTKRRPAYSNRTREKKAQRLHRDEEAWPYMPKNSPNLEVEAMIALTDFTEANGATQIVPGSHLWEPERKPQPHEITQAVMDAGSAIYYLGKTLHGGGANITTDQSRRGMFYGYVVGWLRTGENMFLTVPLEAGKKNANQGSGVTRLQSAGGHWCCRCW